MQISRRFRAGLLALIAIAGASFSSAVSADSGSIRIRIYKAGSVSAARPAAAC